jgi:hypothetical protein
MSTQKQIEANRRNAQHSTGPRAPQGKARFSRLARYESSLRRSYYRALETLEIRRSRRPEPPEQNLRNETLMTATRAPAKMRIGAVARKDGVVSELRRAGPDWVVVEHLPGNETGPSDVQEPSIGAVTPVEQDLRRPVRSSSAGGASG